jgi:hypothetical protein
MITGFGVVKEEVRPEKMPRYKYERRKNKRVQGFKGSRGRVKE